MKTNSRLMKAAALFFAFVFVWSYVPMPGGTAYALGGTVSFTSANGTNAGQVLHDGSLTSADLAGIQLDIYNANLPTTLDTSAVGSFVYFDSTELPSLSHPIIVPIDVASGNSTLVDANLPKLIIIRSHDGTAFSFNSIYVSDYIGSESTIRFQGFRGGVSVGYLDLPMDEVLYEKTFNASDFGTTFQNVDEICISNQLDGNMVYGNYIGINNIVIGDPVVPNAAPVASAVSITGTAQVGQTLTGSYTYSDTESNPEGTSTFQWYRSNDNAGSGKTAIGSATGKTYAVTAADVDKYLSFKVTPVAQAGTLTGTAVESGYTAKVTAASAAGTKPQTGTGTLSDPYIVDEPMELVWMQQNYATCKGSYFLQTADIDMTGITFTPIGNDTTGGLGDPFTGTYDGQVFKISNLSINSNLADAALFQQVSGTVQNVVLENANITCTNTGYSYSAAAGIVGYLSAGTIKNCGVSGTIAFNGSVFGPYVGGIAGNDQGTIQDCYCTAALSSSCASTMAGGIAGYMGNAPTARCYFTGSLGGSATAKGGIVGNYFSNTGDKISNCFFLSTSAAYGLGSQSANTGCTSSSAASMKAAATYTGAGWDFATIWKIAEGTGYPQFITTPNKPTGLSATAGDGQLTVTWNSVSKASGYKVSIGTAAGVYSNTYTVTGLSKTITGLTNGTKYYVAVTGLHAAEEGPVSDEANGVPHKPVTDLAADPGNSRVDLTFSAAAGAGSVELQLSTNGGSSYSAAAGVSLTNASTSASVTGLTNGATYTFRLKTVYGGVTYYSNVVSAMVGDPSKLATIVASMSTDKEGDSSGDWVYTGSWTGAVPDQAENAALKFDLSSCSGKVISAQLYFCVDPTQTVGTNGAFDLYGSSNDAWTTALPTSWDGSPVSSNIHGLPEGWNSVDVTSWAANHFSSVDKVFTFYFKGVETVGTDNYIGIWSATTATTANRPYLVLTLVSTDARLSSIKIGGSDLTGFTPNTTTYNYVAPSGTDLSALVVTSTLNDSSASQGAWTYDATNKKWTVTVTAEDGTTMKTYTINVSVANAAPAASNVAIAGTAQVGQTLTGSYDYSDGESDAQGTSTFQWYRSNSNAGAGKTAIAGATATTYVVTASDLGKYLSFAVTPVAQTGTLTGSAVESNYTPAVVPAEAAPVASNVAITGTAQVGQTLSGSYDYSDVNGDAQGTSTFQWYRSNSNAGAGKTAITGATGATYVVTAADLSKYLTFAVTPVAQTGTLTGTAVESGYTSAVVPAEAAPVAANVAITGTAQVGQTLTGNYDYSDVNGDAQGTSTFQWYRSNSNAGAGKSAIAGATSSTYVLQTADLGKYLSFEVKPAALTGMTPGAAVESSYTSAVVPAEAAPVATGVTITGITKVAQTLTGNYSYSDVNGDLEGASTYQWYRSDDNAGAGKTAIAGATGKTYVVAVSDLGKYLTFAVTPVAQTGTLTGTAAESDYTAAIAVAEAAPVTSNVQIAGTAATGQTLTGSYDYSDANGDPEGTSTYQWYRANDNAGTGKTAIVGATGKTYTLQSADLNRYICFEVTPVAQTGTTTGIAAASAYTGKVVLGQAAPEASNVKITGTPQVGQTLTGSYGYNDVNGDMEGTSTFRWYRSNDSSGTGKTAIAGATSITYVVQTADLGKYVSFEVTPVALTGTATGAAVESALTAKVVPAEGAPTASNVTVTGTARVGQTLTGSYDYNDVNGDLEGSSAFQWYRSDDNAGAGKTAITGATGKTYVLTDGDIGKWISFAVTPAAATGATPGAEVESGYAGAVWKTVTVSFDAGDGTVSTASQVKRVGSAYGKAADGTTAELLPIPDYAGHAFGGWWTKEGGTGTRITDTTTVTAVSDHTLYAKWVPIQYTVNYLAGAHGTLNGSGSETVAYGGHPSAVPDVTADTGYTFLGWSSDGGVTTLSAEQVKTTTVTGVISYTAQYRQLTYSIGAIADQTLAALVEGYKPGTQPVDTLTITRAGTGDLEHLSVALAGANADSFVVTQPGSATLTDGSPSTTFTLKAKDGLPKGTYTAQVTISADNMTTVAFTVSQVVNKNPKAKLAITFVVSDGKSAIAAAAITVAGQGKTTDGKGKAVYELAPGSYGFTLSKTGYTDSTGNVTVGNDSSVICLVMAKKGTDVLPDNGGTGTVVIADDGTVPATAILVVEQVTPDEQDDNAVASNASDYHIGMLLDVRLLLNSVPVQPGKPVTVGVPIPPSLMGKTLMIVRINDDGTVTKFTVKLTGNMLFFTTDHFSKYALLAANEDNPDTGDRSAGFPTLPFAAGALAVLLAAAAVLILRKRRA